MLVLVYNQNILANNVDPDEMAQYEPSHLELHCFISTSAGLKELRRTDILSREATLSDRFVFSPF